MVGLKVVRPRRLISAENSDKLCSGKQIESQKAQRGCLHEKVVQMMQNAKVCLLTVQGLLT